MGSFIQYVRQISRRNNIFYHLIRTCTCVYQGVRYKSISKSFAHVLNDDSYGYYRSSHPEVSLGKRILKICSKFTGKHPCQSVISIKLQSNFIEITLRHGCSPVSLLILRLFSQSFCRGKIFFGIFHVLSSNPFNEQLKGLHIFFQKFRYSMGQGS